MSYKSESKIRSKNIFKLIFYFSKSHLGHASLYYFNKNNNYYFFDIADDFVIFKSIKFQKYLMNYSKDCVGLVLRTKKKLTVKQKKEVLDYIGDHMGYNYGVFSVLFLLLESVVFKHLFFYRNLKNPFATNTNFCSENIVRAYESAGIYLGIKDDPGTISPVDLLNSNDLKIVGYINEGQK